jgi:hypothetical protein
MKAVAVVVMVVGLTLMSAPFVLPHFGISLAVTAPKEAVAEAGEGVGGSAGFGAMLIQGVGSVVAYFGVAPNAGEPSPADVAAEFDAACAALSDSGAGGAPCTGGSVDEVPAKTLATSPRAEGRVPGVSIIETSVRPTQRGGAKFLKVPGLEVDGEAP